MTLLLSLISVLIVVLKVAEGVRRQELILGRERVGFLRVIFRLSCVIYLSVILSVSYFSFLWI